MAHRIHRPVPSDDRRHRARRRRVEVDRLARAAGQPAGEAGDPRARSRRPIRRLGYVYHRGAANLRRSVSDVVGMVINDLTNPFFAEMTVGLEAALQTAGLIPFLANTGESRERQAEVMRAMREHGAVGYVLCPAIGTAADDLAEVEAWGLPVVTVMRRLRADWISSVSPDNVGGARRATEHLLALGHRRIAFLGGRSGMVVHEDRRAGWATALRHAGIAGRPGARRRDHAQPRRRCRWRCSASWRCPSRPPPPCASTTWWPSA